MSKTNQIVLRHHVRQALENYFENLDGYKPANLYEIVLQEVETPLIRSILKYTNNNQSIAADILGISRGTLRKKMSKINIKS